MPRAARAEKRTEALFSHLRGIENVVVWLRVFPLCGGGERRFGSGALVFAPMVNTLMEKFSKMPTYLGTVDQVRVATGFGFL